MTIGELARRAGVGVETVRYYQRRGLFPEPPRQPRSTREYAPEALALLHFIRRARGLGFTIKEIEKLLVMRRSRKEGRELPTMLQAKTEELERRVRETQAAIEVLQKIASRCQDVSAIDRWKLFETDE